MKQKTVNDRIIEKMKEAGMDASALALAAGVAKQTIYNIENGKKPNRATVEAIAKGLGANFGYLFTGIESKPGEAEAGWQTAVDAFREANNHLKAEVAFYRQLLMQVTGGKAATFLQALNGTGLLKRKSLRAAA